MPLAKESGHTFTPVPAGSHIARAVAVISLGTQPQNNPQFMATFKVMIQWEIPGETLKVEDKDMPMMISKEYTLSLSDKANLRRDLEGWRGKVFTADELKGFDVGNVVGKACMLTVVHKTSSKGSVFASVQSVSGLPKGVACPPAVHSSFIYEIEERRNDMFNGMPEWIQKKIEQCEEWQTPAEANGAVAEPDPSIDDENSVPF